MGASDAAGGGGKTASAADAGAGAVDPSAGLGGTDPSFGMGAFDPSTGLGASGIGDAFGSFGGQIPGDPTGSLSAQQSINPQGLNQPPITDQPQPPPSPQAASQTLPQSANPDWLKQAIDVNHALWHGPTGLSGTPGDPSSNFNERFPAYPGGPPPDVSQTGARGLDASPTTQTNAAPASATRGITQSAATSSAPPPAAATTARPGAPAQTVAYEGAPGLKQLDGTAPPQTSLNAPSATLPTTSPASPQIPGDITGMGTEAGIPSTPPATPPASTAGGAERGGAGGTGGMGGMGGMGGIGSPLEQLVGQFLHMMLGGRGGIGSMLEQAIDRMLGINPQRMFPQYYGGGFNPPPPTPGSGYLPPGATGGRPAANGGAGATPLRHVPGSPGGPGSPVGLGGPGYTPSSYARSLIQIESAGNPNNITKGNYGLGQFSPDQWKHFGITAKNWRDPQVQMRAIQQEANENIPKMRAALGRDPTSAELYLAHQQNVPEAIALIKNPNMPAVQAVRPFYHSDHAAFTAINNNNLLKTIPSDLMTSGQFVNMWKNRFNRGLQ